MGIKEQAKPKAWFPAYKSLGKGHKGFSIRTVNSLECPVSAITVESREILERFGRARVAAKNGGPQLHGQNLSKWPARDVDALVIINNAETVVSNADYEANKTS